MCTPAVTRLRWVEWVNQVQNPRVDRKLRFTDSRGFDPLISKPPCMHRPIRILNLMCNSVQHILSFYTWTSREKGGIWGKIHYGEKRIWSSRVSSGEWGWGLRGVGRGWVGVGVGKFPENHRVVRKLDLKLVLWRGKLKLYNRSVGKLSCDHRGSTRWVSKDV